MEGFRYEGHIYFPDSKLLKCARGVFGKDMVTKAYVGTWTYSDTDGPMDRIVSARISVRRSSTVDEIDNGCLQIAIEFINGNIVIFSNSEWGSMTKVNTKKIVKQQTTQEEK